MSNLPVPDFGSTTDREFVHSRLIDATRERVFSAFAEPEHLATWWGPNGFTSTFDTFESGQRQVAALDPSIVLQTA